MQSSSSPNKRKKADTHLTEISDFVSEHFKGVHPFAVSSIRLPLSFESLTSIDIDLLKPIQDIWDLLNRWFNNENRFIAVLCDELQTDKQLGERILKQLDRFVQQ